MRKLLLAVALMSITTIPACGPSIPRRVLSQTNLVEIGKAMKMYSWDWDNRLPPMRDIAEFRTAVKPYWEKLENTITDDAFVQPGSNRPYSVNSSLSGHTMSQIKNPGGVAAVYEADPDKDGLRSVLFLDGHVKFVHAQEWLRVKNVSKIQQP